MTVPARSPMPLPAAHVTAGLALTGAVLGGIAGALAFGMAIVMPVLPVFIYPAMIGGAIGFVATPVIAWLMLTRVPLGRAFSGLMLGTIIGGLAGWFLPGNDDMMTQPILVAFAGFLIAAVRMSVRDRRRHADVAAQLPEA